MIFSKPNKLLITGSVFLLLVATINADPVDLIKRHRYSEAIEVWNNDIKPGKVDEKGLRAIKGKALAYEKLGGLYQEFHKFSLFLLDAYYADQWQNYPTAISALYEGQIQFYFGNFAMAKTFLEKAKKGPKATSVIIEMADVYIAQSKRKLGEAEAGSLNLKDNAAIWQNLEFKDADYPKNLAATSARSHRCKLKLMLTNPSSLADLENAINALLADAEQPEAYSDQGKNSQINFYDPNELFTLSQAFYTASKLLNLQILNEEKKFPDIASKFNTNVALAENYLSLDQVTEADGALANESSIPGMLLKARILAKQNKVKEAKLILEDLVKKNGKNSSVKRDIAECYALIGIDLAVGARLSEQTLREKNNPIYYKTYGSLLLAMGQNESALAQLAKGYKIEFRNRIDIIDPEYMIQYGFAIFKTNKLRYEEIVETLYHLQKEFPACRQMYYCMQGISAGLARNYESQRILRKGG